MIKIEKVTMDYVSELCGVTEIPQIGWVMESDHRNVWQESYELQISEDKDFADCVYESGLVQSCASQHVMADFYLKSMTRYFIRVKVIVSSEAEGKKEKEKSDWSETVFFTTALYNQEWKADFISADSDNDQKNSKGTLVRKSFPVEKEVKCAYVCATALGLYQLFINGKKVGKDELTPGFTSYHKHLVYQTYEVTDYLQNGENVIGAMIGAGWYKGKMGFLGRYNNYGERSAFLGQLLITYTDGTSETVASDISWKGNDAPVVFAEIYDGETYDAHYEIQGWNEKGLDEAGWKKVEKIPFDMQVLTPQAAAKVEEIEAVPAKRIFITPKGDTVIDFGQNMTGWIHVTAEGKDGDVIQLNCFEVLDHDGNVYVDNLRGAKEQLKYVFARKEKVHFHPHFTFHGFQYAKITSYPGMAKPENFTAYAVHSNMGDTGTFECSNQDINQLQHNIKWGMKGNFVDIPTDCPQRNERLGWTGDAQIFCRTASYLMNTYQFYRKWLKDVGADQTPKGGVPHVIPDILTGHEKGDWLLSQGTHSAAAWADVVVIIPWTLYLTYGDLDILRTQFHSMKKWVDFMKTHAVDYIWNYKLQFGDWVALDAKEGSYFGATPNDLTCTAYFAYTTRIFVKICHALGRMDEEKEYQNLYHKIVKKYQKCFMNKNGIMKVKTQTAHIISLYFDLVPSENKTIVVQGLKKLLDKENGHLVTGFVGTPYFCFALSENGYTREAYDLLLKDDFPSWLYQVKMGATTIWEHWDGIKPDGTMWSPDMNSFNHYAYGAVGEWMYRVCAGIEIDHSDPGYRHIIFQPQIGGNLSYAKGSYQSIYGNVVSKWEEREGKIFYEVDVPVNTAASLYLDASSMPVSGGQISFTEKNRKWVGEVGSGHYEVCFEQK